MAHGVRLVLGVVALSCSAVLGCSSGGEDAGGPVLAAPDAGSGGGADEGGAATPSGSWACDPVGTWRFTSAEACERRPSLLFVARENGQLSAHFVGVRPEGPIASRHFAAYRTAAYFDPATCQLIVDLEVRDRDTGEGFNGSSPVYLFDVRRDAAPVSVMERFNAGGAACTMSATRVAGPAHCPERAVHGEACDFPGPCDSGCGSACHCTGGRWSCEYPHRGAPCLPGERCTGPGEDAGSGSLSCAPTGQQGFLDGTLTVGGDLCSAYPPVAGEPCQPARFTCGPCTCGDPGAEALSTWECDLPDGG